MSIKGRAQSWEESSRWRLCLGERAEPPAFFFFPLPLSSATFAQLCVTFGRPRGAPAAPGLLWRPGQGGSSVFRAEKGSFGGLFSLSLSFAWLERISPARCFSQLGSHGVPPFFLSSPNELFPPDLLLFFFFLLLLFMPLWPMGIKRSRIVWINFWCVIFLKKKTGVFFFPPALRLERSETSVFPRLETAGWTWRLAQVGGRWLAIPF